MEKTNRIKEKMGSADIPNSMWNPGGTLVGGTLVEPFSCWGKRTNNSQNPRGTARDHPYRRCC